MNWDVIGVVAEVLGASGVVVSLIYLTGQVRAQNRESRLAAMHEIAIGLREAYSPFASIETAE